MIYQLCVAPERQRGFIGAALVKAAFERSAYGCRLFCCWCAQDLEANRFWESLGFVPLAFRAGSGRKIKGGRVHIFWQRRIDADDEMTKYWYPFQTNAGAIREDRIVLPIPPGVHWSEVKPVEFPSTGSSKLQAPSVKQITSSKSKTTNAKPAKHLLVPPAGKVGIIVGGRIKYVDRPGAKPSEPLAEKLARKKAEKPPKAKIDKKYLGAARELRDRYLERVNTTPLLSTGKYDVSRILPGPSVPALPAPRRLPDAA